METDIEVKGLGIELVVPALVCVGREDVEWVAMLPPDPAASASAPELLLLVLNETPTPVPTPTPIAASIETTHSTMKNVRLFRPRIFSLFPDPGSASVVQASPSHADPPCASVVCGEYGPG
jgi:hypothetical protein